MSHPSADSGSKPTDNASQPVKQPEASAPERAERTALTSAAGPPSGGSDSPRLKSADQVEEKPGGLGHDVAKGFGLLAEGVHSIINTASRSFSEAEKSFSGSDQLATAASGAAEGAKSTVDGAADTAKAAAGAMSDQAKSMAGAASGAIGHVVEAAGHGVHVTVQAEAHGAGAAADKVAQTAHDVRQDHPVVAGITSAQAQYLKEELSTAAMTAAGPIAPVVAAGAGVVHAIEQTQHPAAAPDHRTAGEKGLDAAGKLTEALPFSDVATDLQREEAARGAGNTASAIEHGALAVGHFGQDVGRLTAAFGAAGLSGEGGGPPQPPGAAPTIPEGPPSSGAAPTLRTGPPGSDSPTLVSAYLPDGVPEPGPPQSEGTALTQHVAPPTQPSIYLPPGVPPPEPMPESSVTIVPERPPASSGEPPPRPQAPSASPAEPSPGGNAPASGPRSDSAAVTVDNPTVPGNGAPAGLGPASPGDAPLGDPRIMTDTEWADAVNRMQEMEQQGIARNPDLSATPEYEELLKIVGEHVQAKGEALEAEVMPPQTGPAR